MAIKEVQGTPNRPGRKGYVTTTFTGADVRKARGMLDKQAKASAERKRAEKAAWRTKVRNYRDNVRVVSDQAAQQIRVMQNANRKLYPRGAMGERSCTLQMGAYIRDGRLIRDGEEE